MPAGAACDCSCIATTSELSAVHQTIQSLAIWSTDINVYTVIGTSGKPVSLHQTVVSGCIVTQRIQALMSRSHNIHI